MNDARAISISVAPEALKLGIKVVAAVFANARISNKSAALEDKKKEAIEKVMDLDITDNEILSAYEELYRLCGAQGFTPPAQSLIQLIKRNGRLPNINTVVDSYNLVSAETFLSIGAHDTDKIRGNLVLGITGGSELYVPLGGEKPEKVNRGEYACIDAEKIVCRMDVRQCEQTKITKETKSFIIYIQGNKNTSMDYLYDALAKICSYIESFCGAAIIQKI
ncbi:hypothetical protein HYV83_02105 [Candidatus Woesearchaeota archaeon]|nr:hypothetical protein [Candidatus Woesearchaeota archaeon]